MLCQLSYTSLKVNHDTQCMKCLVYKTSDPFDETHLLFSLPFLEEEFDARQYFFNTLLYTLLLHAMLSTPHREVRIGRHHYVFRPLRKYTIAL